jgi:hypothetical protein
MIEPSLLEGAAIFDSRFAAVLTAFTLVFILVGVGFTTVVSGHSRRKALSTYECVHFEAFRKPGQL